MSYGDVRLNMLVDETGANRCHGLLSPVHSSNGDIDRVTDEYECILQRIAVWKATKKGERPLSPHFGCCVRSYINEPLTGSKLLDLRADIEYELTSLFPELKVKNVRVESWERNTVNIQVTIGNYEMSIPVGSTELAKLDSQMHKALWDLGMRR